MKTGLLLALILMLYINSYGDTTNANEKLFRLKKESTKVEHQDTTTVNIFYKKKPIHSLEFYFDLTTGFKFSDYGFLGDYSPLIGYKYYHPIKERYLFVNTTHGLGFNIGDPNDKKFTYLSYYEAGITLNKPTFEISDFHLFIAAGILNYNYYTRNPIYFINNNNEIDEVSKLNATYISLRFSGWIGSIQLLYNLKKETKAYSKFGLGVSFILPINLLGKF